MSRPGRRTLALLLGALAISAAPGVPPARADDALSARFRFDRALRLYGQRRFDDALHELFLLQEVTDNPRVPFNIGLCYQQLGRDEEAYLAFAEYLASLEPGDPDDGQRARAEQALTQLEARVARVRVDSDPPGATVFVDRTAVGDFGTTPRLLAVPPGAHTVILELDGHRPAEAPVVAVAGEEVRLRVPLDRVTGQLSVASPTAGVTVRVRDLDAAVVAEGPAPLAADLPPGTYSVELDAPGHHRRNEVLAVAADETSRWSGSLEPEPVPTGRLSVTTTPPGARLRIDGELVGFAPIAHLAQPAGTRRLAVDLDGYRPWSTDIRLEPDAHRLVTVGLAPAGGSGPSPATLATGAAGASILVAGLGAGVAAIDNRNDYEALRGDSTGSLSPLESSRLASLADRGDRLRISAGVLIAAGAVALVTALVLWWVEDARGERESSGAVAPWPSEAAAGDAGSVD